MSILTQIKGLKSGPLRRLGHRLRRLLEQDCLLCGAGSGDEILCPACAADLPHLLGPCCPRCALPKPQGEICGRCLTTPPHFDAALAAYRYDFPVDKLVQAFKYGHRLALGDYFGRQLARLAATLPADLIVPLPLSEQRLRQRGFNQALEISRALARARRLPIDATTCRRTRDTPAQAGLAWRERVNNLRHAFACSADLSGARIILVDDVMTTGASLDECARTLKLHGALEVTALVLARALPKPA